MIEPQGEEPMEDTIWEGGKQVAYVKDGFAFDRHHRKRYKVENHKLLDLVTGDVVGHLDFAGKPGTASKPGLFD
jgi:hypothetical protein